MHSTFDCKMSFLYWLSFQKDKRAHHRSWRINWKAHMHALDLVCTHDIASLFPRKGHALSEHSESSCCRIWCYLAMEQQSHELLGTEGRAHASLWGEGLVLKWGALWLLLCLLFNPFIPKNCQEKNLICLLFFEAFCLILWNEKFINSWGQ